MMWCMPSSAWRPSRQWRTRNDQLATTQYAGAVLSCACPPGLPGKTRRHPPFPVGGCLPSASEGAAPVPVTISAEQRDALYDQVLDHLSGIADLWSAVQRRDFGTADRVGREFSDDLRLILDDLGWGDSGGPVELTMPTGDLRRVLLQLRQQAEHQEADLAEQRDDLQVFDKRTRIVREVCAEVLDRLPPV